VGEEKITQPRYDERKSKRNNEGRRYWRGKVGGEWKEIFMWLEPGHGHHNHGKATYLVCGALKYAKLRKYFAGTKKFAKNNGRSSSTAL